MNLFVFGLGYSSQALLRRLSGRLAHAAGTVRSRAKAEALAATGVAARIMNDEEADTAIPADLASADALLVSIPPEEAGDPALARFGSAIAASPRLRWIGYLSTIGVYGDRRGAWVSEDDMVRPRSPRTKARVDAENAWLELSAGSGKPVAVLRLSGIYGPGRNALETVAQGTARRIIKPGQVFNRIHVDDIASAADAAMTRRAKSAIYNVTDDEPAPPQDVIAFAADLLGVDPPPAVDFAEAELSPMARDFYSENKRVSNARAKRELGWSLRYPTYREGLSALYAAGEGSAVRFGR